MSPALQALLHDSRALKYGGIAVAGVGLAGIAHFMVARPSSPLNRFLAAYAHYLQKRFDLLFMTANVKGVIAAQGLAMYVTIAVSIAMSSSEILPLAVIVAILPVASLEYNRRKRIVAIEQQTDTFILALANALKSTPSIGDAFSSLVPVVQEPLKSEIDLSLKQMRLGCTLEDALLLMAQRVGSRIFDTALASILIGQRVGGNLPQILETSGTALRELNRLEGQARSRTASGRIQLWIIALAPIAFVIFFDRTQPDYFEPLTTTNVGMAVLAGAILLWGVAIVAGRKILAVDV